MELLMKTISWKIRHKTDPTLVGNGYAQQISVINSPHEHTFQNTSKYSQEIWTRIVKKMILEGVLLKIL